MALRCLGAERFWADLILGAIGVFIIEREFMKAAYFSAAGAILTFFGFIHGEKIGFGQTPAVSVSYLAVAAVLVYCAKFALVFRKNGGSGRARGAGTSHRMIKVSEYRPLF